MTPEEYLSLPEHKPYLEYVHGMVLQKPAGNMDYGQLLGQLIWFIGTWKQSHGGRAGIAARARLGDLPDYRIPDLSYWRPEVPRGEEAVPSLAVEVRSPEQLVLELRRKCEFLRSTGVETCWLIDPVSRTAEVYEGRRKTGALVSTLKAECLPGFELPLAELFAVLDD